MAKEKAAEKSDAVKVTVRRCLYRGPHGRAFQSVPFGETLICQSGKSYFVNEAFAYLWLDPQFAVWFEWAKETEQVHADQVGQVVPRE